MNGPVCPGARTLKDPGHAPPASQTEPPSGGLPTRQAHHSWWDVRANRVMWGVAALLAGALLGGAVLIGVRPWPCLVARYAGEEAKLRGVDLHAASLRGAYLVGADLSDANLRGTDLSGANLGWVDNGPDADLRGADLRGACLRGLFWDRHISLERT
jgi:uncharacterized protein YjbI with pentapeptide repeats